MTWLDAFQTPESHKPRAVRKTAEYERIAALPRREWEGRVEVAALQDALTARLRTGTPIVQPTPPEPPIPERLLPAQAVALMDLATMGGAFVPLVTGGGKTLLSLLAGLVIGAQRTVLILPKRHVNKAKRELLRLAPYWRFPRLTIRNYELLPHRKEMLNELDPDLLILDECHEVKSNGAARTKVIKAWRKAHPKVPVMAMSGSMMARDIRDFSHIMRWCLGDNTALPRNWPELETWAYATAEKIPEGTRVDGTALADLATDHPATADALERSRRGLATRITSSPGVVSSTTDLPPAGLIIKTVRLATTPAQDRFIHQLIKDRKVPNGEPCEAPLDLWRHQRSLAVGLWQFWDPPPPEPWLEGRSDWAKACYEKLERSQTLHCPMDVAKAVKNGQFPELLETYESWCRIRPTFTPQTAVEWICDSSLNYAAEWLERERGLCWVVHVPFGDRLSQMTGIPFFRQQALSQDGRYLEDHRGPAIASVHACHDGLNLQHYNKNLCVSPTTNRQAEQWISRTHRKGQLEDDVFVEQLIRCQGDEKMWTQALADARNVEVSLRQPKRLSIATFEEG